MTHDDFIYIPGRREEKRIPSRVLEEIIHQQIRGGHRNLEIEAFGQHGIGGRLWDAGTDAVNIRIIGHSGQRTGSLGNANTCIEIMGPASDDLGWLNAGARIVVHGHASNGVMNGAAQGRVFVGGSIGARGMTMTKHNPRFDPPELWVLGTAGDYFGEFMAGGIAVVCGHDSRPGDQVLGYRPLVGMVGGKVFVRGNAQGFSEKDAKQIPLSDDDWQWLETGLEHFLKKIGRMDLLASLSVRPEWMLLSAKSPHEKADSPTRLDMGSFRRQVWDRELGAGGLIGDLQEILPGTIPVITKGDLRRYVPVWEQGQYLSPCQAACPTGIPVQDRWYMVRADNVDEAVAMGLAHTPFPASVCGYLCPSPCMAACTRHQEGMTPVSVRDLGRAGEHVPLPEPENATGRKMAVIGAGPGGLSAAWHLTLKGHAVTVFDTGSDIGGKIASVIPGSRIPEQTLKTELDRIRKLIPDIRLEQSIDAGMFAKIKEEYDFIIVAAGAKKPRSLPVPGIERAVSANEFLSEAKAGNVRPGRQVVIIGAGNVGCDVATEAHRLGAKEITLIDVQRPAAFGREREDAEKCGARFQWPVFTKVITEQGVMLENGDLLPANTVVVAIGDVPDLDFIESHLAVDKGFVTVDRFNRTSDPKVFAIGDVVTPGLITDAIGAGKRAARVIHQIASGNDVQEPAPQPVVDKSRIHLAYYDPVNVPADLTACGEACASCGKCRDCGICVAVCPEGAIHRNALEEDGFEYRVDADKCIGCGFCKGACPCGIWDLIPNTPI
jgi:NADPH-dependent glutamate synthase beta subunit-like oxidoreductase/glutamate synthase domain-containing protein 3/NAD-dependent dihydropyrimidine dehydrogenase PreA subunit